LLNLWKAENDGLDAPKLRSIKNSKIITTVYQDHCACCCLRRKSVQWYGITEIVLGWREQNY